MEQAALGTREKSWTTGFVQGISLITSTLMQDDFTGHPSAQSSPSMETGTPDTSEWQQYTTATPPTRYTTISERNTDNIMLPDFFIIGVCQWN